MYGFEERMVGKKLLNENKLTLSPILDQSEISIFWALCQITFLRLVGGGEVSVLVSSLSASSGDITVSCSMMTSSVFVVMSPPATRSMISFILFRASFVIATGEACCVVEGYNNKHFNHTPHIQE